MKKTIQFSLLLAFLSITAFINPLKAQDATKELNAFTKRFENAYNKKDVKSLKEMFTKDAIRTGTDGQTQNGNDAIVAFYEELLKGNVTVAIKQDKVVTENGSTVATGTYQVTGTSASGEKIDAKGAYNNIVVKEGGQWKISKQNLTGL
jgi:uncharacterized protein (TIGR02246 family)